jgi:hypothetical protein
MMTMASRAGELRRPSFTPRETRIIDRNEILTSLVHRDPWAVKRALRLLKRADHGESRTSEIIQMHPAPGDIPRRQPQAIDLKKNPDLDTLNRSSPEAALDLLRLLKQAGSGGRAAK